MSISRITCIVFAIGFAILAHFSWQEQTDDGRAASIVYAVAMMYFMTQEQIYRLLEKKQ